MTGKEYLLEEEVVINELLLGRLVHAVKSIERASEVALEAAAGLGYLVLDLVALLVGDAGSKRHVSQVSADSNTGGLDHSGALLVERRAVESRSVHIGNVSVRWAVLVVVLDDLVEEVRESSVGVCGTSVATDTRVDVLAAREDASLERHTRCITLVVVLVPDVLGQVLADERLGALRELRVALEILW